MTVWFCSCDSGFQGSTYPAWMKRKKWSDSRCTEGSAPVARIRAVVVFPAPGGPVTIRMGSRPVVSTGRCYGWSSVGGMPFARPQALRRELAGAFPERPFRIEFWDGEALPATTGDGPVFGVRSPAAVAHALRAPGQLGVGRAYVAGALEVDDVDAALALLDAWSPPPLDARRKLRLLAAAAQAPGVTRPQRAPESELRPRGRRH